MKTAAREYRISDESVKAGATFPRMNFQRALITGASSGLGRGLAVWFAKQGVTVYAAARRTKELDSLRDEVGDKIVPLRLDVADGDATEARVRALDAESGGLDLVVANAGRGNDVSGRAIDWPTVRAMIDVNVTGALATLCGALPGMVERKRGHLVGISSLAALIALPRSATYSASKAFLAMWLEGIALDVESEGLKVTSIHPGFVKSEMTQKNKPEAMPFLLDTDEAVDRMGRAIVRGDRVFAFPWQTATAIRASAAMPRALRNSILRSVRK